MKKRLFFLLMTFVALASQAQTSETELKLACADIVFSQPGVRFMHKIRATNPDAKVAVEGLPRGLSWNQKRSLVEGKVEQEGEYHYTEKLTLDGKTTLETVTLTVSSTLQQPLPFMGWLSWNVVEGDISEEVVKTVA
ncbi:MAG: glycoside hydrolase family 27 protein, partial [Prevotella sp.]|nr:glycoside hydrolase family 27 protein [Prevotella sp.]